jgi:translation initiation factor IF-3
MLLYFSALMSYRPVIKEVRYSLNSDALDKTFKFKPTDKMFESGDDVFITVPKDTEFATAQVTYQDGTNSSVQKFLRPR